MAIKIGDPALTWGTEDETFGYTSNVTSDENVQEFEQQRGDGETVAVEQFGKRIDLTFDYAHILDGPEGQVGTGTAITLTDAEFPGDYYVKSASKTRSIGAYMTQTIQATNWPFVVVTP